MLHVLVFIKLYVAPFLLALGLIQFFRGIVNYFIIGPGYEEDRKEIGRHALLWTAVFFLAAILIYGIAAGIVQFSERWQAAQDVDTDLDVTRKKDLLKVPNTPMPR